MAQLIFDERSMYDGSLFKFEKRLHSPLDRYIEKGALLTTYFSQDENASTVDRGIQDIETLFGSGAPIRYNKITDFPLYGFGQATPEDAGDENLEDFNVEGECTILPMTIVPKPWDFFLIKHLKQEAIFSVRAVANDSMKPEGYYRIRYKLQSTSREVLQKLESQVIREYTIELSSMGAGVNPVITKDNFVLKGRITKMLAQMISSYNALFYDDRHNCYLYHDGQTGMNWFDMCGNEFIAKYSLMNIPNSMNSIMLHDKLYDKSLPLKYLNSVYQWLELDAPLSKLQKFHYELISSDRYSFSSFTKWRDEVLVLSPINLSLVTPNNQDHSVFNKALFNSLNSNLVPKNPYEQLLWKFVHRDTLSLEDISMNTADVLLNASTQYDVWMYTPIIIFIINKILSMPV